MDGRTLQIITQITRISVSALDSLKLCVTSGFCSEMDENCALLGYNTASSGNSLPTFRDNLSVPSSRVDPRRVIAQKSTVLNLKLL